MHGENLRIVDNYTNLIIQVKNGVAKMPEIVKRKVICGGNYLQHICY